MHIANNCDLNRVQLSVNTSTNVCKRHCAAVLLIFSKKIVFVPNSAINVRKQLQELRINYWCSTNKKKRQLMIPVY